MGTNGYNSTSPSKTVDKQADGEGSNNAAHREDGHRQRPQGRHGCFRDDLPISIIPCLIVEGLNDLKHKYRQSSLKLQFTEIFHTNPDITLL